MDLQQAATAPLPQTPPQVMTQPAAPPTGTTPTPSNSGSFQDSLKKAVSNPVQLGFGILVSAALFYTIYYMRYKLEFNKVFVANVENKIDELDIKYADILSKLNESSSKETTPQQELFF